MNIPAEVTREVPSAVVVAVLDEPPFCWLDPDGSASGCDVEVARAALHLAGVTSVEFRLATFPELIPGVLAGRWHLNTGMFITEARRRQVRFTRSIWAMSDGLIVRRSDADRLNSYAALATDPDADLGVVVGQVQGETAARARVPPERISYFTTQDDAVQAVRDGRVDAAASTAIGNRAYVARLADPRIVAVDVPATNGQDRPLGAFSLSPRQVGLADALDTALSTYLGSAEHRDLMLGHGFTHADLNVMFGRADG
jgi:polar amino acid transport system substrate-binding protein